MFVRLLLAVVLAASCLMEAVAQPSSLPAARGRAVLIYPRERSWFRRIFYTSHQRELRARIGERYETFVREQVTTDDELFGVDVDGASLLVLSAHGDAFSMYFSSRERRTLDATDRARLAYFLDRLDPFATIVLQSCETGRGFAHVVKEAAGPTRRVIAARGEVPWNGMQVTSVAPFEARILCRDGSRVWDCTLRLSQ
jgi:hypothetical protein